MITYSPNSFTDKAPIIKVGKLQLIETEGFERISNYYPLRAVGIVTGFLLCTLNKSGLTMSLHLPTTITNLNMILSRFGIKRPD